MLTRPTVGQKEDFDKHIQREAGYVIEDIAGCYFAIHKKDAHIRSAETAKKEKAAGRGNVLLYLLHPVSGEYSKPFRYREVTSMNLSNNNRMWNRQWIIIL